MSKEFYIHHKKIIPWEKATEQFGAMTYDDVLIKQGSDTELLSRSEANTETMFGPYTLSVPIVTAPMDTISGERMIREMHRLGGIGSLPRGDLNTNLALCETFSIEDIPCLYTVGLKNGFEQARQFKERGAEMLLVDIAHGGMHEVQRLAGEIKNKLDLWVVAGNITTYEQAKLYKQYGIDIARVGVGGGSACSTRMKTGVGFPQLNALFETTEAGIYVIADGGIRAPGDAAKALAVAEMIMLGGMFAGTEETPGHVVNGKKVFRGQASAAYMKDNKIDQNGYRTDEGITHEVTAKGQVRHVVDDITAGLRSAMSYVGARNLAEYREKAQFIHISPATQAENRPHIQNVS